MGEVVTFDFENVAGGGGRALERQTVTFNPGRGTGGGAGSTVEGLFWELGIPTPPFATVDSLEELRAAVVRGSICRRC